MKVVVFVLFFALVAAQDGRTQIFHPPNRCSLICPAGQRCFQSAGHMTCEREYPRCTRRCAQGQVCELVQPTCIRAPCFPIETCLPISKSVCRGVRCMGGMVCVARPSGSAFCERPY